jgi:hypothetical protein
MVSFSSLDNYNEIIEYPIQSRALYYKIQYETSSTSHSLTALSSNRVSITTISTNILAYMLYLIPFIPSARARCSSVKYPLCVVAAAP